jgi:hypothetical protein
MAFDRRRFLQASGAAALAFQEQVMPRRTRWHSAFSSAVDAIDTLQPFHTAERRRPA